VVIAGGVEAMSEADRERQQVWDPQNFSAGTTCMRLHVRGGVSGDSEPRRKVPKMRSR
jgi:hypothetical protein